MFGTIFDIGIGFVAASVIWFFVWRNNKSQFADALDLIDKSGIPQDAVTKVKSALAKLSVFQKLLAKV